MAVHRPPQASSNRRLLFYIPPLLISIVVVALLFLIDTSETDLARDMDLCPVEAGGIAARSVFLLDLRKPLPEQGRSLGSEALRALTLELGANTELEVFAVTDNAGAPRQLLDRLCKPYGNADLAFEGAKDRRREVRDCDDLPAQLPNHVRGNAEQFCARRTLLGERIEQLAAAAPAAPLANAYLVEALEETSLELSELSGRRSLYVFSDMLQHAPWYSHLELGWNGWSFADFMEMRTAQDALVGPRPPPIPGLDISIFYVPRTGVTDLPRMKRVHQHFWQEYFAEAKPSFHEQALMPEYPVAPLMNRLTEAEQERTLLRQEREEAERLLAQVEQERAALDEARRQADAEERAQQARMDELRRQRELLQAEEARRIAAQAEAARQAQAEAEALAPEPEEAVAEAPPDEPSQPVATEAPPDAAPQPAVAETPTPEPPAVAETPAPEPSAPEPPAVAETPAPESPAAAPAAAPEAEDADAQAQAEALAADLSVDSVALEPCAAHLKPRFHDQIAAYPGRIDYGSATVVIQFTLNDRGETVPGSVEMLSERSVAEQPAYLSLFSQQALNLVRSWEFDFADAETGECARSQQLVTQFGFQYSR